MRPKTSLLRVASRQATFCYASSDPGDNNFRHTSPPHLECLPGVMHSLEEQPHQRHHIQHSHTMHQAPHGGVWAHHAGAGTLHDRVACVARGGVCGREGGRREHAGRHVCDGSGVCSLQLQTQACQQQAQQHKVRLFAYPETRPLPPRVRQSRHCWCCCQLLVG